MSKPKKKKLSFREEEKEITFTCPKRGVVKQLIKVKVYESLPVETIKTDALVEALLEESNDEE